MRNRYIEKLDSIIKIKVEGKNINNYIKRIIKRKINIIKLIPISYKEVHIILTYNEYHKLTKYKSIYKITIIDKYGKLKIKQTILKNKYILFSLFISLILLIILSKITFTIDIIHQDKEIRELLKEELTKNGIKKYTLKKNYNQLEKIEDKILKDNKDKLEWIEIVEQGTKYIVKIEERKLNEQTKVAPYQHIVSKKNAMITEIIAQKGEKVKFPNEYVKKGETIISGIIPHTDNTSTITNAEGTVYGEVWYKISLEYPFVYQEENLTGRHKTIYVINFINKRFSLFDFNKYKSFSKKNKTLLYNPLINISLVKEKQYELNVKDEVQTIDIAITQAKEYIKRKLKQDNKDIEKIKDIKILSQEPTESTIQLKLFITTIEEIGTTKAIEESEIPKNPTEEQPN